MSDSWIGTDLVPPMPQLPVQGKPAPTTYIMEPDLVEAQTGQQHLPDDVTFDDAGFAYNKITGNPVKIVRRPNVLPIARTPEGFTLAMPKVLDVVGNVMGGVAGAPVKAGEVLLGSGAVRKTAQAVPEVIKASDGPFYSGLERAVESAKVGKADAQQWTNYLKNQPGVKSEELSYVLKDLPEGPISKEQLGEIIKGNKVELKEVTKGDPAKVSFDEAMTAHGKGMDIFATDPKNINSAMKVTNDKGEILPYVLNNPDKFNFRVGNLTDFEKGKLGTKYHSYQLPGGENYKEMLLTLPDKRPVYKAERDKIFADFDAGKMTRPEMEKSILALEDKLNMHKPFTSSHWDEPNILAHIRHNDRMVDGKKSLHVEEIQSDWHQAGRKQGYKLSEKQKSDLDSIENKLTTKLSEAEIGNPDIDNVLKVAVDKKVISSEDAKNYKDYVKGENSTVPDAPFKKNWDELALKRMLHKAADEGYEGISWTPGEAQAARYDLSKSVDKINWSKNEAGDHLVRVAPTNSASNLNLQLNKEGKVTATFPASQGDQFNGKHLSDVVGKEIAEKILNKTQGELAGEGLKIGGEGMKSFYDKMLVDKANALTKKYGSKVEFKNSKAPSFAVYQRINKVSKDFPTAAEAREWGKKNGFEGNASIRESDPGNPHAIHYLPITPELRAKAKEGFPMFSFSPTTIPVDFDPWKEDKAKRKVSLVKVDYDPFK